MTLQHLHWDTIHFFPCFFRLVSLSLAARLAWLLSPHYIYPPRDGDGVQKIWIGRTSSDEIGLGVYINTFICRI